METYNAIYKQASYKAKRPIILTVDDNEDNLLIMNYVIKQLGISFVSANTGSMALSLAREYLPNLILLDIVLPDINGIEVFKQLKNNPLTKKIPVIAVTALALKTERELLKKTGFDSYLSKPYLLEDLKKQINYYFKEKNFLDLNHSHASFVVSKKVMLSFST